MMNRRLFFNESANTWDDRFHNKKLEDFLEQIVPSFNLARDQRILDAGTGTGILIPFLLKAVGSKGHITAIDYAEKMVDICKAKYGHLPNVSVKLQLIEKMDFASESFDAITCFGLLPHLDNKVDALNEMNRVLKPGGRLIIAHALSSTQIKAHHRNVAAVAHDVLPEEQEMKHLLKKAGFTSITIVDKSGCYLCISGKPST